MVADLIEPMRLITIANTKLTYASAVRPVLLPFDVTLKTAKLI